mgnify:FL=1
MDSILTEWDEDEFREFLKEEYWKKGHEAGEERGEERGKIIRTVEMCQEFQVSKEDTLQKVKKDFSLDEEKASEYLEKYWK